MPLVEESTFRIAMANIAGWGDTDVFPFPVENHIMHDVPDLMLNVLCDVRDNFSDIFNAQPVWYQPALAPVGYTGFRWATQIDPMWNAYLLSLVLTLAPAIESERISRDEECVYSYRYEPSADGIFWTDGWKRFQERTRVLAVSVR